MKLALALATAGAILAMASPVLKRDLTTEVIVELITVTVTANVVPTSVTSTTTSTSLPLAATSSSPPALPPPPPPPPSPAPQITPPTHHHTHHHLPTTSPQPSSPPSPPPPPPPPPPAPTTSFAPPPPPPPAPSPTPSPVAQAPPPPPPQAAAGPVEPVATNPHTNTPFAQACLDSHNIHRKNHTASAVTWDSNLASYAQTVANSCVWGHNLSPGGGGYGQNIATYGSSDDLSADNTGTTISQAITNMWYNGELPSYAALYGQENPDMSNFSNWGHFTQVVWKASTTIGCAVAYCPNGEMTPGFNMWFSVCNYASAGNVGGTYADNVGEPLGDATVVA